MVACTVGSLCERGGYCMEQKTKGGEKGEEGREIDRWDEDMREKTEWTVGRKRRNRGGGK